MAKSATITKVSRDTRGNHPQILLILSNGKSKYYQESYLRKVMDSNLMEERQSFLHLIGATVSFDDIVTRKNGDKVLNADGSEGDVSYSKLKAPIQVLTNFEIDWASCASSFVTKQMNAQAVADATVKAANAFGVKPKAVVVDTEEEEEEEDEQPAKEKSVKVK